MIKSILQDGKGVAYLTHDECLYYVTIGSDSVPDLVEKLGETHKVRLNTADFYEKLTVRSTNVYQSPLGKVWTSKDVLGRTIVHKVEGADSKFVAYDNDTIIYQDDIVLISRGELLHFAELFLGMYNYKALFPLAPLDEWDDGLFAQPPNECDEG